MTSRVRAMRSRLLDGPRYAALLASGDLPALVRLLSDTPYRAAVPRDESTIDAAAIENGLRRDLCAAIGVLRSACGERWREWLDLLMGRWEAANLNIVLWSRQRGASVEETLAGVYPIGWSDEVALAELARQPTLDRVADTLVAWRHPFAGALKAALSGPGFRSTGDRVDLFGVAAALDRAWVDRALGSLDRGRESERVPATYLGYVIDVDNLLTALNGLAARGAGEMAFLPGGMDIAPESIRRVARAADWEEAARLISGTRYGPVAVEERAAHPPQTQLERQIRRHFLRRVDALAWEDPLGFGLVIGYVERKIGEIHNLRMIAHGLEDGLDPTAIRPLLALRNGGT